MSAMVSPMLQSLLAVIGRGRSNGASQRDILKAVSLPRKPLCAKSPKKPEFTGELFVTWHRSTTGSHHYLMGYISGSITVEGDPDHEAEDAAWVPLHDLTHELAYPNERRIVGIALDLLYRDAS